MVKHLSNKFFKPLEGYSDQGDLLSLINNSTTCTLDRSVESIKHVVKAITELFNLVLRVDHTHPDW
jgi:hypothetical protein